MDSLPSKSELGVFFKRNASFSACQFPFQLNCDFPDFGSVGVENSDLKQLQLAWE